MQYVFKFFCKFSLCLLLITNELVIFAENHKKLDRYGKHVNV